MKSKSYKENNFRKLSKKLLLVLVFLLSIQNVFCQDDNVEIITHNVELGETMLMISRKYLVDPTEIYRLNTQAVNGISEGMVLNIPQTIKSKDILTKRVEKKQKANKSLTDKENKYFEKLDEKKLEEYNKSLAQNDSIANLENVAEIKPLEHRVISGETLIGISKKYNISVEELISLNKKTLEKGLKADQFLIVSSTSKPTQNVEKTIEKTDVPVEKESKVTAETETIKHIVLPKETFYGISKKYNVSVDEIKQQNKEVLAKGLLVGIEILIKIKK